MRILRHVAQILFISFLTFNSRETFADRVLQTVPFALQSFSSSANPRNIAWVINVRCVNLSEKEQEVKAEILDLDAALMVCTEGLAPPGSWTKSPIEPPQPTNCWWKKTSPPQSEQKIQLVKGGIGFATFKHIEDTGLDPSSTWVHCARGTPEVEWVQCSSKSLTSKTYLAGVGAKVNTARVKVTVSPDVGAVACSVTVSTGGHSWGSAGQGAEEIHMDLNGGRPF